MPEQILDLFPLEEISPKADINADGNEDELAAGRAKRMQANLIWCKPLVPDDGRNDISINRAGTFYRYYRNVEDLSEWARAFYEKAG